MKSRHEAKRELERMNNQIEIVLMWLTNSPNLQQNSILTGHLPDLIDLCTKLRNSILHFLQEIQNELNRNR